MKEMNKTYAIVEVIDGEKIQLVRGGFIHTRPQPRRGEERREGRMAQTGQERGRRGQREGRREGERGREGGFKLYPFATY